MAAIPTGGPRRRWLAGALAAALLAAGCGLLPREKEEPAPVVAPPVKSEKEVHTVRRGDIVDQVTLRARFAPARAADLAFTSGGRLQAVHVRAGDQVRAGQVLAELHTEDLARQLAQAEIRHQKVQLSLENARYRAQFNRTPTTGNELKSLELDLESARLDLEKYRQQLADSRLAAPFAGQVTAVPAKVGDNVAPYATVVTLADPTDLLIEADVDDAALLRVAVGQKARLEFSGLDPGLTGTVVELPEPGARPPGNTPRRIRVRPDQPQGKAAMGMVGRVHVVQQEKQGVLLLANAALRQFSGRTYVLMKEPRREVDVATGVQGETETEILRGLKEGNQVLGR